MTAYSFETAPSVSLNRVRIVDLPGLPLDEEVRGKRADELLSNRALMAYAAEHASVLGLQAGRLAAVPPQLTRGDVQLRVRVPEAINAALAGDDAGRRAAGEAVARRLGCNLGWLLIALHRGDDANRKIRPDWGPTDWETWKQVMQVWLGGGLACGRLGDLLESEARQLLRRHGYQHIGLARSPYGAHVALVGAARAAPAICGGWAADDGSGTCTWLGLDFGHTLVKRAVLSYRGGMLVAVRTLPSRLVDWNQILPAGSGPAPAPADVGGRVLDFVTEVIAASVVEVPDPQACVVISVAAYLQQGRLMGNGPYASIHAALGDGIARDLVTAAAGQRLGRNVRVGLIHDGTAASLAHAGTRHGAVIVMGTALGVGFPPPDDERVCRVIADLQVT